MAAQTHIKVQVNRSKDETPLNFDTGITTRECEINIQVAAGWAIIGHYRDQTLQAVTLKKSTELETN